MFAADSTFAFGRKHSRLRLQRSWLWLFCAFASLAASLQAQDAMPKLSRKHGLCDARFALVISPSVAGRRIHYTTDGSTPTTESPIYTGMIFIEGTTIVRAAEVVGDTALSRVATATYIFPKDILMQANSSGGEPIIPDGYPATWGSFIAISGTAPAYYAMDSHIVSESKSEIQQGFADLPIVSVSTDRSNLFGTENDEQTGGIYIYTGAPIGTGIGRGWERPISLEVFGGAEAHDLTIDCGLRIHGGHSRVPEKTPKHAFRLKFRTDYGSGKLFYPIFGPQGVAKFDDLVLRTFFGNSWTHWDESGRQKAQYTRDLWARSVQERLGWPHSKGQTVHLFLNGLYWGIYNLCERITAEHCAAHYGGKKTDYDVVKVEETEGEKVVASDGTLTMWTQMMQAAERVNAANTAQYYLLQGLDEEGRRDESLPVMLDMDNFIDYMLINFYAGNTDWDTHNWLAIRRNTADSEGFRFICWDTEMIFVNVNENVTGKNNGGKPTHLLQCLMRSPLFKARFNHRAHLLLTGDGLLTETGAVAVWDSLYHQIENAVYDECARWGDYRRDIHPYSSAGHRYRIRTYYMNERNRLLTSYFPQRTQKVLDQLKTRGWYDETDVLDGIQTPQLATRSVVFDLQGRCVGSLTADGSLPSHLPRGIYVVGGRKVLK